MVVELHWREGGGEGGKEKTLQAEEKIFVKAPGYRRSQKAWGSMGALGMMEGVVVSEAEW